MIYLAITSFDPYYSAMHTLTTGLAAVALIGIVLILVWPQE